MCGLCGVVRADPSWEMPEAELAAMRDSMRHRGPDDAGSWIEPGIALGSRRLSIVDLSANGHMPMMSADSRFVIAYNGEVYNYRTLRSALSASGHHFRSNTDTEVIVELYARQGLEMLDQLNGMFAFAIWDRQERSLVLVRDRLGVKPLYYAADPDGTLRFASEAKALFTAGLKAAFDESTWSELLCFRFAAGEQTPFAGVRRLLPGHILTWRDGKWRVTRWWNLAARARELRSESVPDADSWYRDAFDDAVGLRRISDVPLGVLLSGGLDSGSTAASLALQSPPGVESFTVRFDEPGYDEGDLAAAVARQWRLKPHELVVKPTELLRRLSRASWLNDEPLVHGNELHILAIAEHAKRHVTVLLSGEGADETLGGYVRYGPLRLLGRMGAASLLAPAFARLAPQGRFRKLARLLSQGGAGDWVLFNACNTLPRDLASLGMSGAGSLDYRRGVLAEAESLYPGDLMRQAMYSDQHTFLGSLLDRNDRMTMGASIECRVPFLDYRIVERLAALPSSLLIAGRASKPLLRRAVGSRLPQEVMQGRKWGFGVPWLRYFRSEPELRDLIGELPELDPISTGPLERRAVRTIVDGFLGGSDENGPLVQQLAMLAIWHRCAVEGAGAPSEANAA